MTTCENCGVPQGSCSSPGYTMTLNFMAGPNEPVLYKKKRDQRRTVWTCCPACAIQTMFVAALADRKKVFKDAVQWPMTLREFTSQMNASGQLDFLKPPKVGQTVTKTIAETRINIGEKQGQFPKVILGHVDGVFVTKRSGRPRLDNPLSPAQRMRRYRDLKRSEKRNHDEGKQ